MQRPTFGGFFQFIDVLAKDNPLLLVHLVLLVLGAIFWTGTQAAPLFFLAFGITVLYLLAAYLRVHPMAIRGIRTLSGVGEYTVAVWILLNAAPEPSQNLVLAGYAVTAIPLAVVLMARDLWVRYALFLHGVLIMACGFAVHLAFDLGGPVPPALILYGAGNVAIALYYHRGPARSLLIVATIAILTVLGIMRHF